MSTHGHAAGENGNKWVRHEDGLFHCSDVHPGCNYTHPKAASVGRHGAVHTGKPYGGVAGNPDLVKEAKQIKAKRDYSREYYLRNREAIRARTNKSTQATTAHPGKETNHVNGTNSHAAEREHEVEKTLYFLAGGGAKDLQSAARALDYPLGELTERFIKILRATNVR